MNYEFHTSHDMLINKQMDYDTGGADEKNIITDISSVYGLQHPKKTILHEY